MEMYVLWLIIAIFFTVLEIFTSGFAVMCFGIGALFASVVSCFAGTNAQILTFVIGSGLSFALVRPFVMRFMSKKKELVTNADALIGRQAVVSETIDTANHTGRVAIDGDDWKAIAENNERIEKGQIVTILSRDSIILTVKK